jgi:cytochrome b561
MTLHWLIAALLIANIGLAWYFAGLPLAPDAAGTPATTPYWTVGGLVPESARIGPIQIHKSIGITVLLLSLVRLGWRLINPPPPLPSDMPAWERRAAATAYVLFYVVMIGMPLSGWAMVSATTLIRIYPITFFGFGHWPTIEPLANLPKHQMHQAEEAFGAVHEYLAYLAYALVVLHVAAALRHQFIRRDTVMARMIPFLRGRPA